MQVAEQEAHRVAHAPIGIGHALQDLVRTAHLARVVGRGHPQPQHVGAQRRHHLVGRHDVAERLGHLAALLVDGEAVGQHALVGRALIQRLRHQQRAVEPAAMLVRAFQVHLDRRGDLGALLADALEAHARVGPHVHDVGDLAVLLGASSPSSSRRSRSNHASMPPVSTRAATCFDQLLRARMQLAGLVVHEQRDRHAPGALARDAPVRPRLDHAGDALLAPGRESTAPSGCRAARWRAGPSGPSR